MVFEHLWKIFIFQLHEQVSEMTMSDHKESTNVQNDKDNNDDDDDDEAEDMEAFMAGEMPDPEDDVSLYVLFLLLQTHTIINVYTI